MSSSDQIRWSGLAAFVGGTLFLILDILETVLFGNQPYAEAAATGAWIFVQGFYVVSTVLIALGLIGLTFHQSRQSGTLGLVAFVVAFTGNMLISGAAWSETFFGAWLAGESPELLRSDPSGALAGGLLLTYVLFTVGWFLFGLASLQANVLPRGAAVLLMVGAVLFTVLGMLEIPFAGLLFGAAVAWFGYSLWTGSREQARIAEAAM